MTCRRYRNPKNGADVIVRLPHKPRVQEIHSVVKCDMTKVEFQIFTESGKLPQEDESDLLREGRVIRKKIDQCPIKIREYAELKRIHKDDHVQPLALHRINPKSHTICLELSSKYLLNSVSVGVQGKSNPMLKPRHCFDSLQLNSSLSPAFGPPYRPQLSGVANGRGMMQLNSPQVSLEACSIRGLLAVPFSGKP
ncbi:hypothetical protein BTVI_09513 [Pitangus sulphuratus]|nr:hypothetical protein BTVI_09513 [Pitangus sulphuratus]